MRCAVIGGVSDFVVTSGRGRRCGVLVVVDGDFIKGDWTALDVTGYESLAVLVSTSARRAPYVGWNLYELVAAMKHDSVER